MKIINIFIFPANLTILTDDKNRPQVNLNFDGCRGEFTRSEWKRDDDVLAFFSDEDKEKILDALDRTSNVDFFAKEDNKNTYM